MTQLDPDILIHPRQGQKEGRLPERALLVVNPAEASFALSIFKRQGGQKRILYNSNLLVNEQYLLCVAGPALGAPAAGLVLEKLIALGVKDILLISCCGAVDPALSVGDTIIPTSGVPGEGVSRYYQSGATVHPGTDAVRSLQKILNNHNISFKDGTLWSTDAPYRERSSELFQLQEKYGITGVDMEFSALCSISTFRKVRFAGLFIVSDELWGATWKPGFTSRTFRNRMHSVIEAMISHPLQKEQC